VRVRGDMLERIAILLLEPSLLVLAKAKSVQLLYPGKARQVAVRRNREQSATAPAPAPAPAPLRMANILVRIYVYIRICLMPTSHSQ